MGKQTNGILGDYSGKVGKVVGSSWNGVAVVKSTPKKSKKAKTPKQEEQQAKFKTASDFALSMHDLLLLGFKDQAVRMTGANYGLSHIVKNAIDGTNPDFKIAYDRVVVSKGRLPNVEEPAVSSPKTGTVQFTWTGTEENGREKPTDLAILVAYCPELNRTVFKPVATREDKSAELNVPKFKGKVVHTWLTFMSANGKLMATSVYTGSVTIT
ncbi:hypothetical protein FAM09_26025 [Niastella caeni]|uniref:Uncharacterized protein n=1 Tax=Niastella caeni TaxID=2569763 RepID=A0A4S8HES5_9BACT|nr:DUF6266 family protein [Niastella caeni]THU32911.1 hypothetical protein FAM09_26025 [Niastella caeni]